MAVNPQIQPIFVTNSYFQNRYLGPRLGPWLKIPIDGYALVKHIQQVSDNLLQVEEGSLYPALQRLLREGLLDSEAGTSAKGRPTRIYRVTDAGLRHLEQEVSSFEKMFAGITRVLAVDQA
jgi:DNA-binding PadR family transcriptional regulator